MCNRGRARRHGRPQLPCSCAEPFWVWNPSAGDCWSTRRCRKGSRGSSCSIFRADGVGRMRSAGGAFRWEACLLERRPRPSRPRAESSVDGNLSCQHGPLRTFLKCSMSTVERLLRQQALPVVEVGRKVLVRRSSVKSWVAAQEIPIEHKLNSPSPHWPAI
jgi:excisionase family DNA binding protein